MRSLALNLAIAFVASVLLTKAARLLAVRWGAIDCPDGQRKLQQAPVPMGGGVAVYLACLAGGLVSQQFALLGYQALYHISEVLMLSAGAICLLGCLDDRWDLNGRLKLLLQIAAVLPIVFAGYHIQRVELLGCVLDLGQWGGPLTVLWLVGFINAMNLLDGMDGMAAVVGMLAAASVAIIAYSIGHQHVAVMAILLVGSLAGFLVYNRPPARIYLGDSGSTTIGLLIGIVALEGVRKADGALPLAASAAILAIPMIDTVLAIVRRKLSGRCFDDADRGHLHHCLLHSGLTNWQALGVTSLLCALVGASAMAAVWVQSDLPVILVVPALVVALAYYRLFGHHEWALVRRWAMATLTAARHRWIKSPPVATQGLAERLQSRSLRDAWLLLIDEVAEWPVARIELSIGCESPQSVLVWVSSSEAIAQGHPWTVARQFTDVQGAVCQLRIAGCDARWAEPPYLPRLNATIECFQDHWSQQRLGVRPTPGRRLPRTVGPQTTALRDAA